MVVPSVTATPVRSFSNTYLPNAAILQKYLDNFDLSIKVIYIVGTLVFAVG